MKVYIDKNLNGICEILITQHGVPHGILLPNCNNNCHVYFNDRHIRKMRVATIKFLISNRSYDKSL
jgi:hypothetical protein